MTTRKTNPFGKSRTEDKPYAIFQAAGGSWEWRVLKTYRRPDLDVKDRYGRWFCSVTSPHTRGYAELGDTYARKNDFDLGVSDLAVLVAATPEFLEAYRGHVRFGLGGVKPLT